MFFPLIKVLNLKGFLELSYLPPNNWENHESRSINLYLLWPNSDRWNSAFWGVIKYGETIRIETSSVDPHILESGLCLVYPTVNLIAPKLELLPEIPFWYSNIPEWRCTSGLLNELSQTSYQSEIYPLPTKASMLTFHPFIQFNEIDNYLLILNVIREPKVVPHEIELFNSANLKKHGVATIRTNSASVIELDQFGYTPSDLPLFVSRRMAGIPFGLGVARDGSMISLEHTHPPASLVLFGKRNQVQGKIKKNWLQRVGDSN